MIPIIMSGGTGSRLWPLSRQLNPKQFLPLAEASFSMLQATIMRLKGLDMQQPRLICNEEHRFLAAEQLRKMGMENAPIMLEPAGRNTAPAVAIAAIQAQESGDDPVLLILAADHLIQDEAGFRASVTKALPQAEAGKLVAFGVVPTHPETGYGYIQRGAAQGADAFAVQRFVEKPDSDTAREYVDSGEFFWNSGMFAFPANLLLAELGEHSPEIVSCMKKAVQKGTPDGVFFRFHPEAMQQSPADSLDYALMEKTKKAAVVEADFGWNDIGSWQALQEVTEKDAQGNAVSGDVLLEDVENCLIRSEDTLVAAVGLRDTLVVETSDAVLVAPLDRSQDVKKIVSKLKQGDRGEFYSHRTVYRPWGSYTTLEIHDRFQIKRITVNPGARLSSQMHHHRHEHWVVVRGTARVENGDQEILLREDESTYIPLGTTHRLENPGVIPLELIEIQIGSYLGEDDIVRFDDEYGRNV